MAVIVPFGWTCVALGLAVVVPLGRTCVELRVTVLTIKLEDSLFMGIDEFVTFVPFIIELFAEKRTF